MSLLHVRNLNVAIHGTPILNDIGFALEPGQIMGLVGESGSGKSMTSLAVMGLLPGGATATGQILLDGQDLTALDDRAMGRIRGRDIGMIFQEPMTALNPMQTIGDQVAETLMIHGAASRAEAQCAARDRLDRVGLQAFPASRYPHELSGGQRQRVCIAMAVALRPRLLIADEPTTALDVTTQAQILALLGDLVRAEGMSLLMITHDLAVVAGLADRVAVMQHGRIVEDGAARDVFRLRRHAYTRRLFAATDHRPVRQPARPADPATPVLQVEGAVRDYTLPRRTLFGPAPRLHAVRGVSFALHQGESLGLVGESGCGKSTLTRAILGLEPLQGGRITLDGQEVLAGRVPPDLRAKVQVVFQDPYGSFNPRHKVSRLIAEPFHLRPAPDRRDRVAEALRDVGLMPDDMNKYIHEFSGGQRQRIAIARALIIRPRLIVLDEAVSALDVQVRAQILDLLAGLQDRLGLSYLFISHDLSVVRAITDRVMIMRAGQIVEDGPTEAVFADPAHDYTKTLIAATPQIPQDWRARDAGALV
ncbi:ABC transporter ATP-binding protein [Halodurantibacterium flavum]|uniref:ABC transporter ATP-binding protein n=1 Tax=Halodurantibacterium flavum TaxID=1382802 RepID=A0ABW4S1Q9_9RHOB